jgi:CelD/BcsL family acetyltransferase involved in cellulose biosynthesis
MQVNLISGDSDFLSLRREWNSLLEHFSHKSVFLTHQWFDAWWEGFGRGFTLNIFEVKDRNRPVGYAPLMRHENTLLFMASEEVTDYCDFLYDERKSEEFFSSLLDTILSDRSLDRIDLINLRDWSPTQESITRRAEKKGLSSTVRLIEVAPVLELPGSYEVFLSGLKRKNRHELRRKLRRAERLTERTLVSKEKDILPEEIEDFIRLHRSWGENKGVFWEERGMEVFFKSLFPKLSAEGWARMDSLFSGDNLAASLLSFEYGGETSLYNIAFSRAFASFSPGYTLFNQAIKQAIQKKMRRVDFLRGSEKYKYEFGAEDRRIVKLSLNLRGTSG